MLIILKYYMCMLSHVQLLVTTWTVTHQAPLFMRFPSQGYWSELPFPPLGDLPDPGIELTSLVSPVLAGDSLPLRLWEAHIYN